MPQVQSEASFAVGATYCWEGQKTAYRFYKMQSTISLNTLNLLTVEKLLAELEELYPPINPTPDTSLNQIMYRSGQASVVEWIRTRLTQED